MVLHNSSNRQRGNPAMEDAMNELEMGSHTPGEVSWQGGNEHVLLDASYYLDDLLRNLQGNVAEGEAAGIGQGASAAHLHGNAFPTHGFGHPIQTIPIRRPSPFPLGSLPHPQTRGVAQPVPQRLVPSKPERLRAESDEEDSGDMSSEEHSEQTNSQSLITHRSVRSDPGVAAQRQGISGTKRGRSVLGRGVGEVQQSELTQKRRSSPRVSWKEGGKGGSRGGGSSKRQQEESDDEEKKSTKGAGGGNREAVRKYRAKKKAQAREMELQTERLRSENVALTRRLGQQADLEREVGALRSLVLQLYQRLGENPPPQLQQAAAEAGHTADSDKPNVDTKAPAPNGGERVPSPSLLPTGNSTTLANVVLGERERDVPDLAAAALPDFPGNDWLAAMSAMDPGPSTLTALPPTQAPLGFSYQNAALLPNKSPLHSTIEEGLAFSAPSQHQDFGARFDSSD